MASDSHISAVSSALWKEWIIMKMGAFSRLDLRNGKSKYLAMKLGGRIVRPTYVFFEDSKKKD